MKNEKKVVLVTGAASGIGLAITKYLLEKGDHVIAVDINEEGLKKIPKSELLTSYYLDVTKIETIKEAVSKIEDQFDGLDGLVNSAGLFFGGALVEVDEKKMEKILAVNVMGVFNVTKCFFPMLLKNKGRIVNIGSETGRFAFPLNGPYTMTKYALEAFSDSLRREIQIHDMKVIHLQVGAINTPLLYQTFCSYRDDFNHEETKFKKMLETVTKVCEKEMERGAKPVDVAKIVYKGLHKRRPKIRYRVKNNKLRRLLEFLPTSLVDFAMKKLFK